MSSIFSFFIDPLTPTDDQAKDRYRLSADVRAWGVPLAIGIALLVASAVALMSEELYSRFYFAYHIGWIYCLTIALGAMCFVMIQHVTNARWSPVVRRIPEVLLWSFPALAVLSIPMFFGMHELFHWTHLELYDPQSSYYDPIIAGKRPYLNTPFFVARFFIYFIAWTLISYKLYRYSVRQDVDGDAAHSDALTRVSAWGLVVYALTVSFAGYDFVMSMDPHWFSMVWGVYFWIGGFVGAIAFITLVALIYRRQGHLADTITREHYHDMGKLLFGFIVFWAYIAFSQYMLIWYANLAEETLWFRERLDHGWEFVSQLLLWGHFVVPFFVLLPRAMKRTIPVLGVMAAWTLFIHAVDVYWMVMPVLDHSWNGPYWIDVAALLGMASLFWGMFVYRFNRHSTVPYNDPYFQHSLAFENE